MNPFQIFLLILSYIPLAYSFITTYRKYRNVQHLHLIFASSSLAIGLIWFTFDFFGYLLEDPLLFKYSIYPYFAMELVIYFSFDIMAHEQISSFKIFLFGCVFTSIFLIPFNDDFDLVVSGFNLFFAVFFSYSLLRIILSVPKALKPKTRKIGFFLIIILVSSP